MLALPAAVSAASLTLYNSTDCSETAERPVILSLETVQPCNIVDGVGSFNYVCDAPSKTATIALFTSADCGFADNSTYKGEAKSVDGACSGPPTFGTEVFSFNATGCGTGDDSSSSSSSSTGGGDNNSSSSSSSTGSDDPGAAAGLTASGMLVAALAAIAGLAL